METLLPSEVARLVLGYLEEEKCTDAAKCFLDCSHHLNEYRILAQRGRKYPTKVNGYSLKEVLEEYCLVHSIVQESLSSMTEQPNGGSLIDNLRYVVRHCQPVQVHINLHPQGQNTSTSKSDSLDSTTNSTRPRSRKATLSQGQAVENVEQTQPALNSTSKENIATEGLVTISSTDTHPITQPPLQLQDITSAKTVCTDVNKDTIANMKSSNPLGFGSCQSAGLSSHSDQNVLCESNSTFQIVNVDKHQEQHPLTTTTQLSDSSLLLRNSQQLPSSAVNSNHDVVMHTGPEYLTLEGAGTQNYFAKPEESNRSFVTKCFGSSIVILDNNTLPEPSVSNLPLSNSLQENYDSRRPHANAKIPVNAVNPPNPLIPPNPVNPANPVDPPNPVDPSNPAFPVDPQLITDKVTKRFLKHTDMLSKFVENINKNLTPSKETGDPQVVFENTSQRDAFVASAGSSFFKEPYLDEFLQDFLQFDHSATMSSDDEPDVEVNGVMIRKVRKLKRLCKDVVATIRPDLCTPSKQSLVKLISSADFTVPERTTPLKGALDGEVMTPITKLLNSITTSSGELFLEPTQLSNLMNLPASATKCKEQTLQSTQAPAQSSQLYPLPLNNVIEVPQPCGPPLHIPVVNCSPTEVVEFSNQEGVSTLSTGTIEVVAHQGSYKPIVPKLKPGQVWPTVTYDGLQSDQPRKRQHRTKRCTTRGGRQSSGQERNNSAEKTASATQTADLITIYGADGEECKTVSCSSSSDLPILVSDTPDVAAEVHSLESDNCDGDSPPNTQDKPNNDVPKNVVATSEDKESNVMKEGDNTLPPLNGSLIRNTPGFNRTSKANEKRMSFSTPRRRLSHIRALDFNTPPKENDQSIRRANTSPKNMSTNALSPNTTGKSIKSSLMGSLFKAPGDGLRRTSKVKAHLFKSPEYPMTLSSGYKFPSAAITSTPCEASCSKDGDSIPPPSGAWDKIGGVSLILDSAVSPVKRAEPPCKKELKSWDADLRSLLNSDPQPLPSEPQSAQPTKASKATKASAPAPRKRTRGKKNQKTEVKSKEEELLDGNNEDDKINESIVDQRSSEKSHELSTTSDCEMAKILENNLMDASSESVKKDSPLKSASILINEENVEIPCETNVIEKNAALHESSCGKTSLSETITEGSCHEDSCKALSQSDQSNTCETECNMNRDVVSNADSNSVKESVPCTAQASKEAMDKNEGTIAEKKVSTPVSDGLIGTAVDKFRLTQVTFKESFSFETPLKDNTLANMVPQTPCFLDPSSQSNEDTPRTKIIKSIPFPLISSSENSESTTPTVPPTPTIRTTPAVSPNCVSYFQPKESPSRRTQMFKNSPKIKSFDHLNNVLVQECTRLEASGMRELAKKSVLKSSDKSGPEQTTESKDDPDFAKNVSEEKEKNKSQDQEALSPDLDSIETNGCARLLNYKRKPHHGKIHKLITDTSRQKNSSSDENVDCMIISPQKITGESSEIAQEKRSKSFGLEYNEELSPNQHPLSGTSLSKSSLEGKCGAELAPSPSRTFQSLNTVCAEIQEAQEVLGRKIFGNKLSIIPSKPLQSLPKLPTSPTVVSLSEEKQTPLKSSVGLAVSNVVNLIRLEAGSPLKRSLSTPVKIKSVEKSKMSSTKKKTLLQQNHDSVVTDEDDSSDSSSSGSSSDSDSDTSSSSSSEEGTPIKENVSPDKQPTPLKSRTRRSSEKGQPKPDPAASPDTHEQIPTLKSPQADIAIAVAESSANFFEVVGSSEQVPQEDVAAASVNLELKSLIETKDMGSCQRIASSRNAHSAKASSIIDEMQEKRRRTLELLKRNPSGRCKSSKDKVLNPFATQNKPESMKPGAVPKGNHITVADKQPTKDLNSRNDMPKKRLSKSESDKSVNETESQEKLCSASDSNINPISDEEEAFVLHLSGDEKDEAPPETLTQTLNEVEEKVAALHGDVSSVEMSVHGKSIVIGTQKVIHNNEKEDQLSKTPEVCIKGGKVIVKSSQVSSQAADEVIKTLLEKGFGCALPPPPTEKIKKVTPTVEKKLIAENKDKKIVPNEEKSDKLKSTTVQHKKIDANPAVKLKCSTPEKSVKKVGSTTHKSDKKTSKPNDSVNLSKRSISRGSINSADAEEQLLDGDDEDEACVEKINTSVNNALEIKLTYKGLGHSVPKREICIIKALQIDMEGQPICLSDTGFLSFFQKVASRQTPKSKSVEKQSQISVSKVDKISKSDSSRRSSGNRDADHRVRSSWDGGPSRQDIRSRRNGSPSPRFKRGSHCFYDRSSVRDTHRSQDYNPRRDRRHEPHSSHHRKSPESESRQGKSSSSRLKLIERKEAEEGEIFSTDSSDFEVKPNHKRKKASSPPYMRPAKRSARESMTTAGRDLKESDQAKSMYKNSYSPLKAKRTPRRVSQSAKVIISEISEKERRARRKVTIEKQSEKLSTANEEKLRKDSQEEIMDDVNLDDDTSFPVLGDDDDAEENDAKEMQPNSSNENIQSGMVTRRRAPPRSVNAHKMSTLETSTPIQKGKRKLSMSPDVVSEDSCSSAQSSTDLEGQQARSFKKAPLGSAAPTAKILKPNNKGEKVAETEIIKNLDVESFLSKLHG